MKGHLGIRGLSELSCKHPLLNISEVASVSSRGLVGGHSVQRLGTERPKRVRSREGWGTGVFQTRRESGAVSNSPAKHLPPPESWGKLVQGLGMRGPQRMGRVPKSRWETGIGKSILKLPGEGSVSHVTVCPCPQSLDTPTLHVVIKSELLACPDGPRGKESDAGQPLVKVVYEDVVHLEVGVALGGKARQEGEEGASPLFPPLAHLQAPTLWLTKWEMLP